MNWLVKGSLTVLLLLTACFLYAQDVGSIVFEQDSDYQFGEDVLLFNIQTRVGAPYSMRVVNDDVKRLFGTGMFSDVVSEVRDMPNGKKEVIFKIVPRPLVGEIVFKGNKKYSTEKLEEFVLIGIESPLNDRLLTKSAEELREFYAGEGLNDAIISSALERMDNGNVRVVFNITENLRLRINDVNFEGNTVFTDSELRGFIATRYSFWSRSWLTWLPVKTGGFLDREELEKDRIRLREMYWRAGHLDFKVVSTQIEELSDNPEMVNITFTLEEGEPYTVGTVTIHGNERFTEEELMPLLSLQPGMIFNVQKEEADLNALEQKYSPLGYAEFQKGVLRIPDYTTHTVDLEFHIKEGQLFRIRDIFISGNRWTQDNVIRREIPIVPMDPVDRNMLKVTKNRLMGMGYFEAGKDGDSDGVEVVAVNSPEPDMKDIDIRVNEKRFVDLKIGAGFSDTDSLAGMVELSHSNMDIFDPGNYFTGGGQRMRLGALVGLEHMDFAANFTEPWLFGIPLRLDLAGYWKQVRYDDWDERRIGFNVSLTKRIFDEFTTLSGGYTFEHVTVLRMDSKLSDIFQRERGSDFVGRIFMSLGRDTRNSAVNPTSGYDVNLFGSVTTRALGASHDYYKLELKGINYMSFLDDMFVLSTGFRVGSTGKFGSGRVPIYDRYFIGGGDTVRGFPFRSIGPEDYNKDNYGGQFMYLLTAELSHPIYREFLRGAVFCDIGDVAKDSWGGFAHGPNIGVGYGLRIKIPQVAVPIRLDLAYPVLNQQKGVSSKLRFHFNMGFSF